MNGQVTGSPLSMRDSILACVMGILVFPAGGLQAHEDPLGEVYPSVVVVDQEFWVIFHDNRSTGSGGGVFRRRYRNDGTLLTPVREVLSEAELDVLESREDYRTFRRGTADRFSSEHGLQLKVLPVARWGYESGFVEDSRSGRPKRLDLDWGEHRIRCLHSFVASGDSVLILATGGTPKDGTLPLELFNFAVQTGELSDFQDVGLVPHVYASPDASRLVLRRDRIHFVWRRKPVDSWDYEMVHSSYDLNGKALRSEVMISPAYGSAGIDIGILGATMGVAYHGAGTEISVLFVKLAD